MDEESQLFAQVLTVFCTMRKMASPVASSAKSCDIESLIVHPSDLEHVNRSGWTALHWAAHKGDVETICLLLDEGANVSRPAANQFTPLALAASFGYQDAVRCLISAEEEAKRTKQANYETSRLKALHRAVRGDHVDVVELLLTMAANATDRADDGQCSDHPVDGDPPTRFVDAILNPNGDRTTVLHAAAIYGSTNSCQLLLNANADLSIQSVGGETPLAFAAHYGHLQIVRLLVEHGGNLETLK